MAALAWWSISEEQRAAFGAALQEAMALRAVSQGTLATHMGTRQSVISSWCYGKFAASPVAIFELENYLELPPGWLSQHFGFGRLNQLERVPPEQAVLEDPEFTDEDRKLLLGIMKQTREYRRMTASKPASKAAAKPRGKTTAKTTKAAAKSPAKAPAKKAPARRLSRAASDG
jgi:hypothetical protein